MINIKSEREIEILVEVGKIMGELLRRLRDIIRPGISTKQLDEFAEDFIKKHKASPVFKGYRGFPASICASVNEVVIHGIPNEYQLRKGDIIGVDIGILYKGYITDSAYTYPVGKIDDLKKRLMATTKESLFKAIEEARSGNRLSDISNAVQQFVEARGFSVVREFCGHGVGRELHEDPPVPNYGLPGRGPVLKAGMTLAVEPMINAGTADVEIDEDGWTVFTKDRSPSAHYEHTIAIMPQGREALIITKW